MKINRTGRPAGLPVLYKWDFFCIIVCRVCMTGKKGFFFSRKGRVFFWEKLQNLGRMWKIRGNRGGNIKIM